MTLKRRDKTDRLACGVNRKLLTTFLHLLIRALAAYHNCSLLSNDAPCTPTSKILAGRAESKVLTWTKRGIPEFVDPTAAASKSPGRKPTTSQATHTDHPARIWPACQHGSNEAPKLAKQILCHQLCETNDEISSNTELHGRSLTTLVSKVVGASS